ncbi:MAG: LEA type 2 family protein [Thiohalobacterales bacterium]
MSDHTTSFGRLMLLVCAVLLLAGCATTGTYPEQPRVSLVSIQPKNMTLLEQRYGLQLRILNPNETAIPLEGLNYSLEINGREFAYGVSRQDVSIPAFGEALLDVDMVSNLLNVMQQVQEMSNEQPDVLRYRLSGKLSLSNSLLKLPFDYHGELQYSPEDL